MLVSFPSSSGIPQSHHLHGCHAWWWIIFVAWLTNKRHLALFPARTIVRDLPHHESPTCHKQDLNLCRTGVQALTNEVVQQWYHYTTAPHLVFVCCVLIIFAIPSKKFIKVIKIEVIIINHLKHFWCSKSIRNISQDHWISANNVFAHI